METYNNNIDNLSGSSSGSRWNPTKEQIDLLENLYREGVRTPSTEQIQQITCKLRAFGYIEGKNVFYWFQNHKARQRQKQKQDNIAIFNRFIMLHQTPPTPHFPTPYPNVACHPSFFIPPPPTPPIDLGCRSSYQKLLIPGSHNKRRPLLPGASINNTLYTKPFNNCPNQELNHPMQNNINEKGFFNNINNKDHFDQETLLLFPLHPTGNLLEANRDNFSIPSTSYHVSGSSGNFVNDRPFIDFLCMDGQCKTT